METKHLYYIGNEHYGFSMYSEDGYRYDWSTVERELSGGNTILIKQPTDEEKAALIRKRRNIKLLREALSQSKDQ